MSKCKLSKLPHGWQNHEIVKNYTLNIIGLLVYLKYSLKNKKLLKKLKTVEWSFPKKYLPWLRIQLFMVTNTTAKYDRERIVNRNVRLCDTSHLQQGQQDCTAQNQRRVEAGRHHALLSGTWAFPSLVLPEKTKVKKELSSSAFSISIVTMIPAPFSSKSTFSMVFLLLFMYL